MDEQLVGSISPFFIVCDMPQSTSFYAQKLGFGVRFSSPEDDPFFAIVGRGPSQIFLKVTAQSVEPMPNHRQHAWAVWDAYVFVAEPDALVAEFKSSGVTFHKEISNRGDGLRGFEVVDPDGYVLFFGSPV